MVLDPTHSTSGKLNIFGDYVQTISKRRPVLMSQMISEKSRFKTTLKQAKERFGPKIMEIQCPVNRESH